MSLGTTNMFSTSLKCLAFLFLPVAGLGILAALDDGKVEAQTPAVNGINLIQARWLIKLKSSLINLYFLKM